MATTERFMPLRPAAVWDALADPAGYGYWVLGSKLIRDADPAWPEPGSRFHHTVGFGPLKLSDHTEVLESDPPHLLQLRAKGRPLGTAKVTMRMTPRDGGTLVAMTENPDGLTATLAFNPLAQLFTLGRHSQSLMRLEELALHRAFRQ